MKELKITAQLKAYLTAMEHGQREEESREEAYRKQIEEKVRAQIEYHSRPEKMSFAELIDIDAL